MKKPGSKPGFYLLKIFFSRFSFLSVIIIRYNISVQMKYFKLQNIIIVYISFLSTLLPQSQIRFNHLNVEDGLSQSGLELRMD